MKIKMSVLGIEETFKEVSASMEKASRQNLVAVTDSFVKDLREHTPVDTGKAKASWSVVDKGMQMEVQNTVPYIQYLNAGSSKQAPAHFIESTALKYGTPIGVIAESRD